MNSTMQGEIWKDIFGYEGYYQISDLGRVKGVPRTVKSKWSNGRSVQERILSTNLHKQGYPKVVLRKNGTDRTFKIKNLVAHAFIPNPEGKPNVICKNGDASSVIVDNLMWAWRHEMSRLILKNNHAHRSNLKRQWRLAAAKKRKRVISVDKKYRYIEYESILQAYRKTGIAMSGIIASCKGRRKTAGRLIWKYV